MKINFLLLKLGNTSESSFEKFSKLMEATSVVEIEDFSNEILQAFPLSNGNASQIAEDHSMREQELSIQLNYLYSWPTAYIKYLDMFPEWKVHTLIGILDYRECKSHWESSLNEFWRVVNESKICSLCKIFVFNMDEPNSPSTCSPKTSSELSSFLRKDLVFIPCQNEEKIKFYLQTLIADLCVFLKRHLIASLSSLKSKERELFLTPDALNESIGSIEGMTRMMKLSRHRKLKVVGDVCQLLGNRALAQKYYKACLGECKDTSDSVWTIATQQSMMEKETLETLHQQYWKLRLYFLACHCSIALAKELFQQNRLPEAANWTCKAVKCATLLTNLEERVYFLLEARSMFCQLKMHRKASFLSYYLAKYNPSSQLNLLYDALVGGFVPNSKSWPQLKLKIIEDALSVCPDDYVVDAKSRLFFCAQKLFTFHSTLSRHRQEEYFGFIGKMHLKLSQWNVLDIVPFFKSIHLSSEYNLPKSGISKPKERIFIYSPIQPEESKTFCALVSHEPVKFILQLNNPLECSVLLKNVFLEGDGFKCEHFDVQILPKSTLNSTITLFPTECERLKVYSIIYSIESWNFRQKLNQNEFVTEAEAASSNAQPLSFRILQKFPLLKVEVDDFEHEIYEGQELNVRFGINSISDDEYSFEIQSISASIGNAEDHLEYEVIENSKLRLKRISCSLDSSTEHEIRISVLYISPRHADFSRVTSCDFRVLQKKSVRIFNYQLFPFPKHPQKDFNLQTKGNSFHFFSSCSQELLPPTNTCLLLCDLENFLIQEALIEFCDFSLTIAPQSKARVIFPVSKAQIYNLNRRFLLEHLEKTCKMTWKSFEASGQIRFLSGSAVDLSLLVPKQFEIHAKFESFPVGKIFHFPIQVSIKTPDSATLRLLAPKEIVLDQDLFFLVSNNTASCETIFAKGACFVKGIYEIRVLILLNNVNANYNVDDDNNDDGKNANECECLRLEIN